MGITLSLWLVSVGLGSLTGSRLRISFGLSFVLVALLSEPTILGIKLVRPLLALGYGETASLGAVFVSTALVLFPLCFTLGLQFPLAVAHRSARPSAVKNPAATVYGLEAAGAFGGGVLFTFLISGRAEAGLLVMCLSIVYILLALYILRARVLVFMLIVPVLFNLGFKELEAPLWRAGKIGELVQKVQSRYGEIWVTRLENQLSLYSAGQLLFTYPNSQVEEFRVHLPMSVHQSPEHILVIGGSPGTIREFLKYPVRRLDFVEIDPELVKTSIGVLSPGDLRVVKDKKVRIITEDGRRFVKSLNRPAYDPTYDIVILNLSEPSTANMNRFYTVEFFGEVKRVLREDGILTMTLPAAAGYMGRRKQLLSGSIWGSLKSVFSHVEVSTEEYGSLFASESPIDINPVTLTERFKKRAIPVLHFHPYIISDAFMPLRAGFNKNRLDAVKAVNTDLKPAAYLYNLMLWAEVHGGRALNRVLELKGYTALMMFIFFAFGACFVFRRRKRTLYYSVLTTGYAGMAFTVSILLGYQSAYGYVYEMFGLLTAVFMVGVAAGAYVMRGGGLTGLLFVELAAAALAAAAPLFFGSEMLFYMLGFSAGIITGCGFAAVTLCIRNTAASGRLYAFDLIGSFIGAFITAIIFIPVLGMKESLLIVTGIKMLSAFLVFFIRDE